MKKMSKVKLGIIGIGNMGSGHAKNIALDGLCPEIELVAVADKKQSRRDWAKADLPESVQIFETGKELIESKVADAVLIATPHYDHPRLAIMAFELGQDVMCEKPAGVYTKAVREMNEAAKKSGKSFGMMFNQRTSHIYRKMKEIVESGELGEIRRVSWIITDWFRTQSYYDSGAWRATWEGEGGGVLLNQCPHNLDLMQWICGMPVKVQSHMYEGKWHDIEVEDDVTTFMEFANGATGTFITSTGDTPGTNRFEITLDGGKLVSEGPDLILHRLEEKTSVWLKECEKGFDAPKRTVETVETDGKNEAHVGVLNAFAAHILRGEPLVANGEEGIHGLTLSNAMHLSAWTGETVSVPFDEDLYLKLLNEKRAKSKYKEDKDITFDTSGTY